MKRRADDAAAVSATEETIEHSAAPMAEEAAAPVAPMGLRYVGKGAGLHNIPARDLTPADIASIEQHLANQGSGFEDWAAGLTRYLVSSGLYVPREEDPHAGS